MGKPVIVAFATDEAWRLDLAHTAACEINAILETLDTNEEEGQIDPDLWRGSYLRLDTLVSVVISSLGSGEGLQSTGELADELYGPGRWCRQA